MPWIRLKSCSRMAVKIKGAHTVVIENDLDQHRAADKSADRNRQCRHLWQNGIADHIAIEYIKWFQTLGLRQDHVIFTFNGDHRV